jgi:hypothetical protein
MDAQFEHNIRIAGPVPYQHAEPVQKLLPPWRERALSASSGVCDSNQESQ